MSDDGPAFGMVPADLLFRPEVRALDPAARLLLLAVATDPDLSRAAVLPLRAGRFAAMTGLTPAAVAGALAALEGAGLVAVDHEDEALLLIPVLALRRDRFAAQQRAGVERAVSLLTGVLAEPAQAVWSGRTRDEPMMDSSSVQHEPTIGSSRSDDLSESESSSASASGSGSRARARGDTGFAEFWDAYPRKADKPKAQVAYARALRAGADPAAILAGAVRYRDDPNREPAFTKYPQGWLTGERWNDGPLPDRERAPTGADARYLEHQALRARLRDTPPERRELR